MTSPVVMQNVETSHIVEAKDIPETVTGFGRSLWELEDSIRFRLLLLRMAIVWYLARISHAQQLQTKGWGWMNNGGECACVRRPTCCYGARSFRRAIGNFSLRREGAHTRHRVRRGAGRGQPAADHTIRGEQLVGQRSLRSSVRV